MLHDTEELKKRLAALDAERDPLVTLITAAERYEASIGGGMRPQALGTMNAERDVPRVARPAIDGTAKAKTEALAMEMADARQRPVPTRDVVKEMRERGLPLPDKNVTNVVSARLSSSGVVKGRRDMGWWPVGKPWPDEATDATASLPLNDETEGEADVSVSE